MGHLVRGNADRGGRKEGFGRRKDPPGACSRSSPNPTGSRIPEVARPELGNVGLALAAPGRAVLLEEAGWLSLDLRRFLRGTQV